MIERKFIKSKLNSQRVEEFISKSLENVGYSHTKILNTPLGERVIIFASRPGLVVGRKGENIKKLTSALKKKFKLENPQIEINEVDKPNLDAQIVAERIASTRERFGLNRFKGIGHRTLSDVMSAGALGVEITISGKVPSQRAKTWRFYDGYLKKCGDIAIEGMLHANAQAQMKRGTVGITVSILPPWVRLPDDLKVEEERNEDYGVA